jgi:hypothetical protein
MCIYNNDRVQEGEKKHIKIRLLIEKTIYLQGKDGTLPYFEMIHLRKPRERGEERRGEERRTKEKRGEQRRGETAQTHRHEH